MGDTMARTLRALAIGAANYHPLDDRRFAPAIKRMQPTGFRPSKLGLQPDADPQRR